MRRALFVVGSGACLGALLVLGYAVFSHSLTDPLVHVLGGIAALGLVCVALATDPDKLVALVAQIVKLRSGMAGPPSDGNSP